MSQPQAPTRSPPQETQQPLPADDRESPATPAQGNGAAPAAEVPASPAQPEQLVGTSVGGKGGQTTAVSATVMPLNMLADVPTFIDCPFCQTRAWVNIIKEGTSMQVVAGVLCCLLCVCLACLPCMAGWCEDVHYSCSECHNRVATKPHGGPMQVFGPRPHGVVPSKYRPVAPPVAEKQQSGAQA